MPTPEETAAAEAAKAQQEADAAKVAADAQAKIDADKAAEAKEAFDPERAMKTIKAQREEVKALKEQNKELEQLRAEKKTREDAELSATELAQKKAAEAEAENTKLKTDIMRRDVVSETGLPAIFADRLKGTTKEEMLADAQELVKTLPTLKVAPKLPINNPNNASPTETAAQQRERLLGPQGSDVFSMDAIKKSGGGVVWNRPPKQGDP